MSLVYQSAQLQLENARSLMAMSMSQIGLGIYSDLIIRITQHLKETGAADLELENILLVAKYELVDSVRKNPRYMCFIHALGDLIRDQAVSLGAQVSTPADAPQPAVQPCDVQPINVQQVSDMAPIVKQLKPVQVKSSPTRQKTMQSGSRRQSAKGSVQGGKRSVPSRDAPSSTGRQRVPSSRAPNPPPLPSRVFKQSKVSEPATRDEDSKDKTADRGGSVVLQRPDERFIAISAAAIGVSQEHFNRMALTRVQQTGLKSPPIAGMAYAKKELTKVIKYPIQIPKIYRNNVRPVTGLLLYGPAGTGKTLLASTIAAQAGYNFFNVAVSDIVSKWKGEAVLCIRALYKMARACAPSVIFIDELDALVSGGSSTTDETSMQIRTEFQTQIDGLQHKIAGPVEDSDLTFSLTSLVITLGATNYPWKLDGPILRRFSTRIYMGLPDEETIRDLLNICVDFDRQAPDVTVEWLVSKLVGYSSAEISSIANHVQLSSYEEAFSDLTSTIELIKQNQTIALKQICIKREHWESVIAETNRVVTPEDVARYEAWKAK